MVQRYGVRFHFAVYGCSLKPAKQPLKDGWLAPDAFDDPVHVLGWDYRSGEAVVCRGLRHQLPPLFAIEACLTALICAAAWVRLEAIA